MVVWSTVLRRGRRGEAPRLLARTTRHGVPAVAVIVVTHLRGRARLDRGGFEDREVRMWAYPYLNVAVLITLLAVIGGMAATDSSRR
ncbi:hypothetical protein ABZS88_42420 [Streptomyces sp. NPDC005480]|jgi:GABA permease/aromatic amino acid permease|uniref:hypothetical protein n=1 Tax=Streptomyces sp. NPDC005480 TaxID=3154880 RepID=UPI0033BA5667